MLYFLLEEKKIKYIFNIILLVVCTQFVFAETNQANEDIRAKLALEYPGKEIGDPVEPQNSSPNEQNINFTVSGGRSTTIEVYFCNDYWASESSWNIFDSNGAEYYSGGYDASWVGSYGCHSEYLSLDDGDYTITLYDDYADGGICAGVYEPGVGTFVDNFCVGYNYSLSESL